MSRTYHHGERKIRVRSVRKDPPDLRRLARALIALVEAEAEAEAAANEAAPSPPVPDRPPKHSKHGPGR